MFIGTCEATFRAEWVTSLKEKRMVVKSLIEKSKHKFNVAVAEVAHQENHKLIGIGFACVSPDKTHVDTMIHHILDFMEKNTEAELIDEEFEVL